MDAAERKRAISRAKELERSGLVDGAAKLYEEAGEIDHAAKVLVGARRYAQAGSLLVANLGMPRGSTLSERAVERLDASMKRRALHAAICFSRAGERELAKQMFLALGEVHRAVEMLQQAGDHVGAAKLQADYRRRGQFLDSASEQQTAESLADITLEGAQNLEATGKYERAMEAYVRLRHPAHAARMARMAGLPKRAAELFTDAGMPYEGALCWLEVGDTGRALETVTRVPRNDPRYSEACIQAITLATQLGVLDFSLENFLMRFLEGTPTSERQAAAFREMAALYVRHDFVENAKRTYARLLAYAPDDVEAMQELAALNQENRASEMVVAKILDEDDAFRRGTRRKRRRAAAPADGLPGLPDLPDLPGLPEAPSVGGGRRFAGSPTSASQPPRGGSVGTTSDEGTQPSLRPPPSLEMDDTCRMEVPEDLHQPIMAFDEGHAPTNLISESQLRQIPGVAEARRRPIPAASGPHAQANAGVPIDPRIGQGGGTTQHPPELDDEDLPSFDDMALPPSSVSSSGRPRGEPAAIDPSDVFSGTGVQASTSQPADSLAEAPPPGFEGFDVGMVLNNRYRFEKKIGQGGMAAVFKAYDLELEEFVAIKIFNRPVSEDGAIKRFKQELSLSRKLLHKNIIRLYDIGSAYGFRFITMELLEGKDLYGHLGPAVPVEDGISWLVQTCDGLQAAHEKGVIHRDIKPHNIFLCDDGTIKVMDFGIAKRQHAPGMTVGNMIAGTPEYMSPEQISGFSSVTHSTDLYALGIVAYQIFTGKVPFAHNEMLPLLMMHINEQPMPPRQLEPSMPAELERIILKLLEKKPEDRFQSCEQVADALRLLWSRL